MSDFQADIYKIADEVRAVAVLGLQFADETSVKSRYERALSASARLIAAIEQRTTEEVLTQYKKVYKRWGPMIAACAAVFHDSRILLVKSKQAGVWHLPSGLVPIGETLAGQAERSLATQTGIAGRSSALLGVFNSTTWHYPAKSQFYHVVFQVSPVDGLASQVLGGRMGFFSEDEVRKLSPSFHLIVPKLFELQDRKTDAPHFDLEKPAGLPSPPTHSGSSDLGRSRHLTLVKEVKEISNELSKLGAEGISDLEHPYARHHYELMESAGSRLTNALKLLSRRESFLPYEDNIGGQSRRLAALAAVFQDGQLLLIRREDTGLWALPGGMTDLGETWARCAQRELQEETTVTGRVVDLLGIFDWSLIKDPPSSTLLATFLVEPDSGSQPKPMPETLGAGFFPMNELPELSPGYERLVPMTIDSFLGKAPRPYVDLSS